MKILPGSIEQKSDNYTLEKEKLKLNESKKSENTPDIRIFSSGIMTRSTAKRVAREQKLSLRKVNLILTT